LLTFLVFFFAFFQAPLRC